MTSENGWAEHKKLVEYRLDKNDEAHLALEGKLDEILTNQRIASEAVAVLTTEHRLGKYLGSSMVALFISLGVALINHACIGN